MKQDNYGDENYRLTGRLFRKNLDNGIFEVFYRSGTGPVGEEADNLFPLSVWGCEFVETHNRMFLMKFKRCPDGSFEYSYLSPDRF